MRSRIWEPLCVAALNTPVREILGAIGEDPDRDGLVDTPARVARMYAEVTSGLREVPEVLFQWRGLRVLDLRDNPVSILPAWLLRMPQLRAIYCDYGTEYNPAFRHQHLEVLRDSLAPLPPPAGWVERKAATGQNAIALPYELELPGRETENI